MGWNGEGANQDYNGSKKKTKKQKKYLKTIERQSKKGTWREREFREMAKRVQVHRFPPSLSSLSLVVC